MGLCTSLALDGEGHPHISYYSSSNLDLKYAHWDGSTWNIETVDNTCNHISLALDDWGNPHISYYGNGDLKYAWWGLLPVGVTIEGGYAWPGSNDNPVTVSADNESQDATPLGGAELWVIYDASVGLNLTQVITTARTTHFQIDWTQDASDPPAVEAHILLYSGSGAIIGPGTGPILQLLYDVGLTAQVESTSTLAFSNVMLSDQEGNSIPADFNDTAEVSIGRSRDGDINLDSSTNLYDLQTLINMVLHTPQPDTALHPVLWWCRRGGVRGT